MMVNYFYLSLIVVFFLSGCVQKPLDRDLNSIFADYTKLNAELTRLDKQYADYLMDLCPDNDVVKLDNADNLFNTIENWRSKRQLLFNKYASINFLRENTSVKEFKEQVVVDELVKLTANFRAAEELIDYSFLQTPDCQIKYIPQKEDYQKPQEVKSCLIPCYELRILAKNMISLSQKGTITIQNSKRSLERSGVR